MVSLPPISLSDKYSIIVVQSNKYFFSSQSNISFKKEIKRFRRSVGRIPDDGRKLISSKRNSSSPRPNFFPIQIAPGKKVSAAARWNRFTSGRTLLMTRDRAAVVDTLSSFSIDPIQGFIFISLLSHKFTGGSLDIKTG